MKNISKRFKWFLFLSIVYFNTNLSAQAPDTMWTKILGGEPYRYSGNSVQQTTDGGYIITGYKGMRPTKIWLIKTDINGDTIWTKTFGGSGGDGYSVQQTTDEGFIIAGKINWKAGLVKTDSNGEALWTKTFGVIHNDSCFSVQQTLDRGYVFTGIIDSTARLVKIDSNGVTCWTKSYGTIGSVGYSVKQTTDEGFIISGKIDSKAWLIKTDSNGDTVWTKTFGGIGSEGRSVQQTLDGGYVFTGRIGSTAGLVKTDSNGVSLWIKTIGGFGNEGRSVQQISDGGYIITGSKLYSGFYLDQEVWLIRTNSFGDTLWTKTFWETEGAGNSVQQTRDGEYIIAGTLTDGLMGTGAYAFEKVLIIKIAPDIKAIEENPSTQINDYQLLQNYPNPFNPKTNIQFTLPKSEFVTLKIYNLLGQEVKTLVSDKLNAGNYKYNWEASGFASGIYYYTIKAGKYNASKKLLLLK